MYLYVGHVKELAVFCVHLVCCNAVAVERYAVFFELILHGHDVAVGGVHSAVEVNLPCVLSLLLGTLKGYFVKGRALFFKLLVKGEDGKAGLLSGVLDPLASYLCVAVIVGNFHIKPTVLG